MEAMPGEEGRAAEPRSLVRPVNSISSNGNIGCLSGLSNRVWEPHWPKHSKNTSERKEATAGLAAESGNLDKPRGISNDGGRASCSSSFNSIF